MKNHWKFSCDSIEIQMNYQWKSIVNPVEISMKFQWKEIENPVKNLKKNTIGNLLEISLKFQ